MHESPRDLPCSPKPNCASRWGSIANEGSGRLVHLPWLGHWQCITFSAVYLIRVIMHGDYIGSVVYPIKTVLYDDYSDKEWSKVEVEWSERGARFGYDALVWIIFFGSSEKRSGWESLSGQDRRNYYLSGRDIFFCTSNAII